MTTLGMVVGALLVAGGVAAGLLGPILVDKVRKLISKE